MRDNWLSNRIFKSCDDIVDPCCFAWYQLVDQPWRIISIGLHQSAHGFSLWYKTSLARFRAAGGVIAVLCVWVVRLAPDWGNFGGGAGIVAQND